MNLGDADKRIPYWATRETWPRGRSCSDNSAIRTYWFRSAFWSAEDRAKLAQEIEQELEYRRRHDELMQWAVSPPERLFPATLKLKFLDSVL